MPGLFGGAYSIAPGSPWFLPRTGCWWKIPCLSAATLSFGDASPILNVESIPVVAGHVACFAPGRALWTRNCCWSVTPRTMRMCRPLSAIWRLDPRPFRGLCNRQTWSCLLMDGERWRGSASIWGACSQNMIACWGRICTQHAIIFSERAPQIDANPRHRSQSISKQAHCGWGRGTGRGSSRQIAEITLRRQFRVRSALPGGKNRPRAPQPQGWIQHSGSGSHRRS